MSNSAAALNNLGMFEEGGREAKRALDRKRDYIPAMINYAVACSSKGNNQDALRYFSAAHASDPSNRNLAINLGILQERMGKFEEAWATYHNLAESGDPQALMGLARIYERRGDRSGATGTYRRILALRDASPALKKEAQGRLARLEEQ
jgi:Flp pilus assembly protein TadD